MNRPIYTPQMRRSRIMKIALEEGIFTDHQSDGVCQQLQSEGWLERAGTLSRRPHVSRALAYIPTEKAVTDWNDELVR